MDSVEHSAAPSRRLSLAAGLWKRPTVAAAGIPGGAAAGLTVEGVDQMLTIADYVPSLGGGTPRFDVVPEPATMSLLALGGLGVLLRRKRR